MRCSTTGRSWGRREKCRRATKRMAVSPPPAGYVRPEDTLSQEGSYRWRKASRRRRGDGLQHLVDPDSHPGGDHTASHLPTYHCRPSEALRLRCDKGPEPLYSLGPWPPPRRIRSCFAPLPALSRSPVVWTNKRVGGSTGEKLTLCKYASVLPGGRQECVAKGAGRNTGEKRCPAPSSESGVYLASTTIVYTLTPQRGWPGDL